MKKLLAFLALIIGSVSAWTFYQKKQNPEMDIVKETRNQLQGYQEKIRESLNKVSDKISEMKEQMQKKGEKSGKAMDESIKELERERERLQNSYERIKQTM